MYQDKITLFNLYKSRLGDMWFPTVIHGVNLQIDKAAIVSRYGSQSNDNAILNIHYDVVDGVVYVDGKPYYPPKEWEVQTNDKLAETVTFESGDFFMIGEYENTQPIKNDDYAEGFYNYMNDRCDFVFNITSVSKLSVIPHFEITGA